ncbi:hypothetical protein [Methylobacterium trifolii]|uniref:Amino acid transporter n=1 Tax=Methylobacterium trifolii TaxID=1003092 RepID=A0ABQ4U0J1_9HYPH|nr:hypothetical protein [Methylobacterium trifolii]GJE59842.1 hypothetical protein MPOCJGCO_1944 [Methylobacterium trifolii]
MSLVHNEQTKLTATLFNGIAIAAVAVGTIAPGTAALLGTASPTVALVTGTIWLTIGSLLHLGARRVLRRLIE